MSRCFSCFGECEENINFCPHCGKARVVKPKEPIYLVPGTILNQRYIIGEVEKAGGFGVIYKAWDSKLETIVAVKEFFTGRLMNRAVGSANVIVNEKSKKEFNYRKARFLSEARNMAKLGSHKNIPNVFEFLEANGTAYIVMELLDGEDLSDCLVDSGGKLDIDFALFVINEVGNALNSLHEKDIIHRDVAPDNIYICTDKEIRVKLLDLGAAKLMDETDDIVDIVLKPGYSPPEQYNNAKTIGVWTDVYALAATLYIMLTGIKPDESTNRKLEDNVISPNEIDDNIPENLSNAIMKAMAVEKHMRFKSVTEFLRAINGKKKIVTLKKERKQRKVKRFLGVVAACLILALSVNSVFDFYKDRINEERLPDATVSMWFSVGKDSEEDEAIKSIISDFTSKFPNVKVEVRAIPEDDYINEIQASAARDDLPEIFESTDLPDSIISNCATLENVLESEQAQKCEFLKQYNNYYSNYKQLPLAIEVPMAYIITNGATYISYEKNYFSSFDDFGGNVSISYDENYTELLRKNNFCIEGLKMKNTFMNNNDNTSAVMLSSSLAMNDVKMTLTNYQKHYAFFNSNEIMCNYTYEWSIGKCTEDETKVAEKLLSWMLGNVYQNTLMISVCSDGQIPINPDSFTEKTNQKNLKPLQDLKEKFVFDN